MTKRREVETVCVHARCRLNPMGGTLFGFPPIG